MGSGTDYRRRVCTCCKPGGATASRLSTASAETKGKSNGMMDIRWLVGRIHVQNVLNEQISSFLYVIGAKTRTKS